MALRRWGGIALLASLLGCDGGRVSPPVEREVAPTEPPAMAMHRLTDRQLRQTWHLLTGASYEGPLPEDVTVHHSATAGSSLGSLGPDAVAVLEAAAWEQARRAAPNPVLASELLGCPSLYRPWLEQDERERECLHGWLVATLTSAWRRPPLAEEVEAWRLTAGSLLEEEGLLLAVQAVLAGVLQSPGLIYRTEAGEPDPLHPGQFRLTGFELASRLSYFLTDEPPDAALYADASVGRLYEPGVLTEHATRLLASPAAREALAADFAAEIGIEAIETTGKDATLFPEATPQLRDAMRAEVVALFQRVMIDDGLAYADLLTTRLAYVDATLASLYGVSTPGAAPGFVELPDTQRRGGILGRAGVLAIGAHATQNSPTLRGRRVVERLLCQSVGAPPAGVDTTLPAPTPGAGTLRQQLEQHVSNPTCAQCHNRTDPPGFAFEGFDPVGRWRTLDNGLPVDTTGQFNGAAFTDAASLASLVAGHEDFLPCRTLHLYERAIGQAARTDAGPLVEQLSGLVASEGGGLAPLVLALVNDPSFVHLTRPEERCEAADDGKTRACSTTCGEGIETCSDGRWSSCDAAVPPAEACDNLDNDCDGVVDELVRPCASEAGPGVQACALGEWLACDAPIAAMEVCNGVDDDHDGATDEDLPVALIDLPAEALTSDLPWCSPALDPWSVGCAAQLATTCAARGCGHTGGGLMMHDQQADTWVGWCLDQEEAIEQVVDRTELTEGAPECQPWRSPDSCLGAVHAWCADAGLTTGYGPTDERGDELTIVCTPRAEVVPVSVAALRAAGDCDPDEPGGACRDVAHRLCADRGHLSGFGPFRQPDGTPALSCLGAKP
jgi:hypothetical protein